MVQYYITPYETGYCFVHDSGQENKYIFSTEKAYDIRSGKVKLFRIDANYFEIVKQDNSVERILNMYIPKEQIFGTAYRDIGIIPEKLVHIPFH